MGGGSPPTPPCWALLTRTFSKDDIFKKHNIWLVDRLLFNITATSHASMWASSSIPSMNATMADGSHPYWPCPGVAW